MAVVAALLFLTVMALCLVLSGIGYYYMRVVRPQLDVVAQSAPSEEAKQEADSLATFVEQLQELARLRDQGILTSREFTSKKTELLERI